MKSLWCKLRRILCIGSQRGTLHSRINQLILTPQGSVRKQAGPIFFRAEHRYDPRLLLQREAEFLRCLDGRHAPRLLTFGEGWIELEHCGAELSTDNLPKDWHEQAVEIATVLAEAGILHRDIKSGNVLVKDGQLYLIDFGWAVWVDETPYLSPRELCEEVPREHIYNNQVALEWLLSSYLKNRT